MKHILPLSLILSSLVLLPGCKLSSGGPAVAPRPAPVKPLTSEVKTPQMVDIAQQPNVALNADNARLIAQIAINVASSNLPNSEQYNRLRNTKRSELNALSQQHSDVSACDEHKTRYRSVRLPRRSYFTVRESLTIENCNAQDDKRLSNLAGLSDDDKKFGAIHAVERNRLNLARNNDSNPIFSVARRQGETRYQDIIFQRVQLNRLILAHFDRDAEMRSRSSGTVYSALLGGKFAILHNTKVDTIQLKPLGSGWQLASINMRIAAQTGQLLTVKLHDGNLKLTLDIQGKKTEINTTLVDLKTNAKDKREMELRRLKDANPTINEALIDALLPQTYFVNPL